MNTIRRLFSENQINEAKISLPAKYNQFYVITGTPGSGKGFIKKNIINDFHSFKEIDFDEGKFKVINWIDKLGDRKAAIPFANKEDWRKWYSENKRPLDPEKDREFITQQAKKVHAEDIEEVMRFFSDASKGKYWKKDDWNVGGNSTHTAILHGIESALGVTKTPDEIVSASDKSNKQKQNYLIDMVVTDPEWISGVLTKAKEMGYQTTLVYVISDKTTSWINNITRGRIVSRSKFDLANQLTPNAMIKIIFNGDSPSGIDRVFLVFSQPYGAGKPLENLNDYLANDKISRDERKEALKIVTNIARKKGMDTIDVLKLPEFRGSHSGKERDVIELVRNGDQWDFPSEEAKDRFYNIVGREQEVDTSRVKNWLRYLRDIHEN